jgi:hypothetical protein
VLQLREFLISLLLPVWVMLLVSIGIPWNPFESIQNHWNLIQIHANPFTSFKSFEIHANPFTLKLLFLCFFQVFNQHIKHPTKNKKHKTTTVLFFVESIRIHSKPLESYSNPFKSNQIHSDPFKSFQIHANSFQSIEIH